jgi:ATP-binding cassette subfamily F protein uup
MSLLSARGVSKAYGARTLFQSVDLTVREGERVGVLGINGTGKSTLLRVLAGEEPMDTGVLEVRRGAKVLYLPQEPVLPDDATAREVIASGLAEWEAATREHAALSEAISKDPHDAARLARQAELGETIERLGGWDRSHVVEEIAAALGIVPLLDRKLGQASGGEETPCGPRSAPRGEAGPRHPRRAHEPPRRRDDRLAREIPEERPARLGPSW